MTDANTKRAALSEEAKAYEGKPTGLAASLGYVVGDRPNYGLPFMKQHVQAYTPENFLRAANSVRSQYGIPEKDKSGEVRSLLAAAEDVVRARVSGDRKSWVEAVHDFHRMSSTAAENAPEGSPLQMAADQLRKAVVSQQDPLHRSALRIDVNKAYGPTGVFSETGAKGLGYKVTTDEALGPVQEDAMRGMMTGASLYYGHTDESAKASDRMIEAVFGGENTLAFTKFMERSIADPKYGFSFDDKGRQERRIAAYKEMKTDPMKILDQIERMGSPGERMYGTLRGDKDFSDQATSWMERARQFVDKDTSIDDVMVRGRTDELKELAKAGAISKDRMLAPGEKDLVPEPPRRIKMDDPNSPEGVHEVLNPTWVNWRAAKDAGIKFEFEPGELNGEWGAVGSQLLSQYKENPEIKILQNDENMDAYDLLARPRDMMIHEDGTVSRFRRNEDGTILQITGKLHDEPMKILKEEDGKRSANLAKEVLSDMTSKGLAIPQVEEHFQSIVDSTPEGDPKRLDALKALTKLYDFGNDSAQIVDIATKGIPTEGMSDEQLQSAKDEAMKKIVALADQSGGRVDQWTLKRSLDSAELKFGRTRNDLWKTQAAQAEQNGTAPPPKPELGEGFALAKSRDETRVSMQAGATRLSKRISESYGDDSPHMKELARKAVIEGAAANPEAAMKMLRPYRDSVNTSRTLAIQNMWAGNVEEAEELLRNTAARSAAVVSVMGSGKSVSDTIQALDDPKNQGFIDSLAQDPKIIGGTEKMNQIAKGDLQGVIESARDMGGSLHNSQRSTNKDSLWVSKSVRDRLDEEVATIEAKRVKETLAQQIPVPQPAIQAPEALPAQPAAPQEVAAAPVPAATPNPAPAPAPAPAPEGQAPQPKQSLSQLAGTPGNPHLSAPNLVAPAAQIVIAKDPEAAPETPQPAVAAVDTSVPQPQAPVEPQVPQAQEPVPQATAQAAPQSTPQQPAQQPQTPSQWARTQSRDKTMEIFRAGKIEEKNLPRADFNNPTMAAFSKAKIPDFDPQKMPEAKQPEVPVSTKPVPLPGTETLVAKVGSWKKEGVAPLAVAGVAAGAAAAAYGITKGVQNLYYANQSANNARQIIESRNPVDRAMGPWASSLANRSNRAIRIESALLPLNFLGAGSTALELGGGLVRTGGRLAGYAGKSLALNPATKALAWGGRFSEGAAGAAPGTSSLSRAAGAAVNAGGKFTATGDSLMTRGAAMAQRGSDAAWKRSLSGRALKGVSNLTGKPVSPGLSKTLDMGEVMGISGGVGLANRDNEGFKMRESDPITTENILDASTGSYAQPARKAKDALMKKPMQNVPEPPSPGPRGVHR